MQLIGQIEPSEFEDLEYLLSLTRDFYPHI
jgi:hypothetical protein